MEKFLLPVFLLVVGFGLLGVSNRVTNIIGGICGIIAAILMFL